MAVPVWGKADPGEFADQKLATVADKHGRQCGVQSRSGRSGSGPVRLRELATV
jgi:hypothetical protein